MIDVICYKYQLHNVAILEQWCGFLARTMMSQRNLKITTMRYLHTISYTDALTINTSLKECYFPAMFHSKNYTI